MQFPTNLFLAFCFVYCLFCVSSVTGSSFPQPSNQTVTCDVIIAGGSLASLAAAVAAANHSSALSVCYLEPTDWPGGQLTASAVPAVDFGPHNRVPANVAHAFASFLFGQSMPDDINLGDCWVCAAGRPRLVFSFQTAVQVSRKCFLPHVANENFVHPLLSSFPNLKTFLMTSVTATHVRGNIIVGVSAVQRAAKGANSGWETLTSR
jgi:hypothetical protein